MRKERLAHEPRLKTLAQKLWFLGPQNRANTHLFAGASAPLAPAAGAAAAALASIRLAVKYTSKYM